jgi:peroxiredoxin
VRIVGVSFDLPEKNAAWAEKKGFNFELWSDTDRGMALYYGAASDAEQRMASRETRLLDAEGNLLLEYDVGLSIGTHPSDVHADCERLWGK